MADHPESRPALRMRARRLRRVIRDQPIWSSPTCCRHAKQLLQLASSDRSSDITRTSVRAVAFDVRGPGSTTDNSSKNVDGPRTVCRF